MFNHFNYMVEPRQKETGEGSFLRSTCALSNLLDIERARQSAALEASVCEELHDGNRLMVDLLKENLADFNGKSKEAGVFFPHELQLQFVRPAQVGRVAAANHCL